MKDNTKAYIYTLFAVLFWAGAATAFKTALQYITPYVLLFYSAVISMIALMIVLCLQKKVTQVFNKNLSFYLKSMLLGFINPFLFYNILFIGYDLLPGQIAMALNFGWPITLSVLSIPLLKQSVSLKQFLSILISFVGAVIIATKGEMVSFVGVSELGVVLTVASTFVWATFWLLNTKDKTDPVVRLFSSFVFGVIFTAVGGLFFADITFPQADAWPALIYVGLFEMGITFVIWITALRLSSSATRVSQLIYITPFLSLLILSVVIGENIYLSTFVGLFLIVAGIAYQAYASIRRKA